MASTYLHADYSVLRDHLVGEEFTCCNVSDFSEYWRAPHGGELWFDIPDTDPHESVAVHFDYPVTTQELELLRFPL